MSSVIKELRVFIIRAGCRMGISAALREFDPFCVSGNDDNDMKQGRSLTHFGFGRITTQIMHFLESK
jgi:hypothetical protein